MPPAAALMAPLVKEEIQTLTFSPKTKQNTEVEVLDHDANAKKSRNSSVATDEKKMPTTVKKEKTGAGVVTDFAPSSRKKKKKTTAVKCEKDEHIKEEVDESAEKKPKRPRISEAIVKDAAQKMLSVLIKVSQSSCVVISKSFTLPRVTHSNGILGFSVNETVDRTTRMKFPRCHWLFSHPLSLPSRENRTRILEVMRFRWG